MSTSSPSATSVLFGTQYNLSNDSEDNRVLQEIRTELDLCRIIRDAVTASQRESTERINRLDQGIQEVRRDTTALEVAFAQIARDQQSIRRGVDRNGEALDRQGRNLASNAEALDRQGRNLANNAANLASNAEALDRQGGDLAQLVEHSAMQDAVLDRADESLARADAVLSRAGATSARPIIQQAQVPAQNLTPPTDLAEQNAVVNEISRHSSGQRENLTRIVEAEEGLQRTVTTDRTVDNMQPVTQQTSVPAQNLTPSMGLAGQEQVLNGTNRDSSAHSSTVPAISSSSDTPSSFMQFINNGCAIIKQFFFR